MLAPAAAATGERMVTSMPDGKFRTRYEKTRIISARALQIAQGAPVLVKVPRGVSKPLEIAELEWEAGVIPIEIKRMARPSEDGSKDK